MTRMLQLNEYGRDLAFNAGIDISAAVSLSVEFTKPDGSTVEVTADLGAFDLTLDDVEGDEVTFLANQYAVYTIEEGLIDQTGRWTYKLLAPEVGVSVPGACGTFEVVD